MVYNIWKLIHILFVIIFLGNITIEIFWKMQADKSKDRIKIAYTFQNIIKADRIFTIPSVTFLIIFGMGAAMAGGLPLVGTTWIFWSIILIIISAYSIIAKMAPIQKTILKLTKTEETFSFDKYTKLSKSWNLWGTLAVVTPYIAVILMTLKL